MQNILGKVEAGQVLHFLENFSLDSSSKTVEVAHICPGVGFLKDMEQMTSFLSDNSGKTFSDSFTKDLS